MSRSTRCRTSRPTSFSFSSYDLRDPLPEQLADLVRRRVGEVERRRVDAEHAVDLALQRVEIPLLEVGLAGA